MELTSERQKKIAFQAVLAGVIILLLGWYVSINLKYPYYLIWDMDHTTAVDVLLVNSGEIPDHINHTAFGIYLPLVWSARIADFCGVLSAMNIDELADSLNPLMPVAELTDYLRLHTPLLVAGIGILLCTAIYLAVKISKWWGILFLAVLGTQQSLAYHSSMIRTELYSVFYWSAALAAILLAAGSSRLWGRILWLLAAGMLAMLSFFTKIQSMFYIAALFLLAILLFSFRDEGGQKNSGIMTIKVSRGLIVLSFVNLVILVIITIAAYSVQIPAGVPVWASGFGVSIITVAVLSVPTAIFLCLLFLGTRKKNAAKSAVLCFVGTIIISGFILGMLLHFLIYPDASTSLRYMLIDFKMMFLRKSSYLKLRDIGVYLSEFLAYVRYSPMIFAVSIIANFLLVLGYIKGFLRITKSQMVLCLALTAIAYFNILIGTRFMLRDVLWKEMLVNFLSVLYFAILLSSAARNKRIISTLAGAMLVILFFANCAASGNMPTRIDANFNLYGWSEPRVFVGVYGGSQRKYTELMLSRYDRTTMQVAKTKAVDHRQIRRIAEFPFTNQDITHRNTGIVFEGFPAWCDDLNWRLAEVPPIMRGAILVDNGSLKLKNGPLLKEEYVREQSEYLDKFKSHPQQGRLGVLTRLDLKIFLFVEPAAVTGLISEFIVSAPYKIKLQKSGQTMELQALEITKYAEIPLDKIGRKFFFVICKV